MPARKKKSIPVKRKTIVRQAPAPVPAPPPSVETEQSSATTAAIPDVPISAPVPEEAVLAQTSDVPPLERKNNVLFIIGIIVSVAVASGSLILLAVSLHTSMQSAETETVPSVTQKSMPTPTPFFQKQDVTFEVLNGSGVAGAAAKAADQVTAAGYTVIIMGNADTSTYATSQLYLAASVESHSDLIIRDLSTAFNISSISGVLTDSTASARLIVGKK